MEKKVHEVQYVLSFGDSQRPERYQFTEAEMKLLYKQLGELLYPQKEMP